MYTDNPKKLGLRERKKLKTRAEIQRHAFRLFREQGYAETTVEQIAEASEISSSTFFRYFPTKESVAVEDEYDPMIIEAFERQPQELSTIQAFRGAIQEVLSLNSEEEQKAFRERMEIIFSIPELRVALIKQSMDTIQMIAKLISKRVGREMNDPAIYTFTGAVMGVVLSTQVHGMLTRNTDLINPLIEALQLLEDGLPL